MSRLDQCSFPSRAGVARPWGHGTRGGHLGEGWRLAGREGAAPRLERPQDVWVCRAPRSPGRQTELAATAGRLQATPEHQALPSGPLSLGPWRREGLPPKCCLLQQDLGGGCRGRGDHPGPGGPHPRPRWCHVLADGHSAQGQQDRPVTLPCHQQMSKPCIWGQSQGSS